MYLLLRNLCFEDKVQTFLLTG